MRKQGARRSPPPKTLSAQAVAELVMPIHVAIELLPAGLFSRDHAADLVAFLGIAHYASQEKNDQAISKVCDTASEILLAMDRRVTAGKSWNVTAAERQSLMDAVVAIDVWMRDQKADLWMRSIRRMMKACNAVDQRAGQMLNI